MHGVFANVENKNRTREARLHNYGYLRLFFYFSSGPLNLRERTSKGTMTFSE
jgi:hypothetical protein